MKKFLLLAGAILLFGSCSAPEAVMSARMLGGSSQSPAFESCRAVAEDELEFVFSRAVTVKNLSLLPGISVNSVENGSTVKVKLTESPQPGSLITADLLAEDENNNSLNVLVNLRSRNNRMPELVINELCTEYSNPRTEYIELLMKSDGNLGAMRVVIMGNTNASKQTIYEFKPVEVKKDDYVMLHLRTVEENCVDEYEGLNESAGRNAAPTARDFWIPGNTKLIHKDATVVYILDQDDRVLASVIVSNSTDAWWSKDYFAQAANFLFNQGLWKSSDGKAPGPKDAVRSAGTTNTRTICRDESAQNPNSAAAWYITVTSGATPGRPNNTNRYSN
ncbi:MAG: hypothetical protein LBG94_00900 [Treponema sp.]|jgi:hypothetical protein|nr:hypothetical protein [Treponema sp.]